MDTSNSEEIITQALDFDLTRDKVRNEIVPLNMMVMLAFGVTL